MFCGFIPLYFTKTLKRDSFLHMKVLYAAAEISPFAKMTSTADMLRFLPASLQDKGFEIRILLPKYGSISDRRNRLHEVIRLSGIEVEVGKKVETMRIKVASIPNAKLQVYFLDNDTYYKRKFMFHDGKNEFFDDNDERLTLYNKGVLETVKRLNWKADIVHCHDWASGILPMLLKTMYANNPLFADLKVIYNLHTPEHHGFLDPKIMDLIGLHDLDISDLLTDGKLDFVKVGVKYADFVVTGNYVDKEFNPIFEQFGKTPVVIQGAPADVSQKFSDFYKEIAGDN